ncbi:MAG: dTDP-4-dehydrorhamnose 3,5-epimerase family protein [Promethearchaeota archaeon]
MDLIEGVIIKDLKPILDERGYLIECFRSDWPIFEKFGQAYITTAFPNVVKAWHYHKVQTDNMVCIKGNAKLVLYDSRENSRTYKKINEIFFGEKQPRLVSIPNKVMHGFKAIGNEIMMVLNCPTEVYNYSQPDEYRLPYNTEEIEYDWEIKMG